MISKTIGFRGVPYFQTHPFPVCTDPGTNLKSWSCSSQTLHIVGRWTSVASLSQGLKRLKHDFMRTAPMLSGVQLESMMSQFGYSRVFVGRYMHGRLSQFDSLSYLIIIIILSSRWMLLAAYMMYLLFDSFGNAILVAEGPSFILVPYHIPWQIHGAAIII